MSRKLLIVLAVLSLLVAACGEEETPDAGDAGGGTSTEEGDADGDTLTLAAFDFGFEPSSLSLDAGETVDVSFENTGDAPHTFTSDNLGVDVRAEPGETVSATIEGAEDGTYPFRCDIHPDRMTGEIIVGTGGEPDEDTTEGGAENDDGESLDY